MKVIWKAVTHVLHPSPLKRNLVLRFTKEGAQEMMKDALTVSQEGQWNG
jgi:hypothetical protein